METTATTFTPSATLAREWSGLAQPGFVVRALGGKMVANKARYQDAVDTARAAGYRIVSMSLDTAHLYDMAETFDLDEQGEADGNHFFHAACAPDDPTLVTYRADEAPIDVDHAGCESCGKPILPA